MIAKWYPNREDPQFGVFIRKHAQAISKYDDVTVLYVHSATMATLKFEIVKNESESLKEIIIYYRKNNSIFGKIINTFNYFLAVRKGLNKVTEKQINPDIIHAYILTRTGIIAWYLSLKWKIPFIVSEQWSGYVTGKFLKSSWINKAVTRFIVDKAYALTSVSSFLLNRMEDCGLDNSSKQVIPNVIENYPAGELIEKSKHVNVLIVADLVDDIKNISGVIKMIGSLDDEIPFNLKIIGRGPDEMKLKKQAKELNLLGNKIFFEGLKPNNEVYDFLRNCDFLVMNSRYETFSLICAEAMSCGKPVLATRCGGPDEFITPDTGILIETDNDVELRKNFLYMLAHYRDFDAVKIKEYSYRLFSKEKIGHAFHQLFQSIIISRSKIR